MNDSEFDDILRTAGGKVPLPESFRSGVWHRIESAGLDSPAGAGWLKSIVIAFARPWVAATGLAATVAIGLWLGAATVPKAKDAKTAYAESISPFIHSGSR